MSEDETPAMRLRGLAYGLLFAALCWWGLWELYCWLAG